MIIVTLLFLGLVFGSFAGAQVWRLRAAQLVADRAVGEGYDKKEYKKLLELTKHSGSDDRSRCLRCGHGLSWYDLLPLVSWLSTRGKCRYCNKPIGLFEPLIEIGTAVFFVVSLLLWPLPLDTMINVTQFVLWLIAGILLAILFAYDAKWFLLPDKIMFPLIVVAMVFAGTGFARSGINTESILSLLGALAIMSGLYFVIWLASKGRWIGFGDVKLGIALGLLLGRWELAFLALFLANLIGCLIVIPGLLTKRLSRTTQVPFGPMLIIGAVIAVLVGDRFIAWYLSATTMLML